MLFQLRFEFWIQGKNNEISAAAVIGFSFLSYDSYECWNFELDGFVKFLKKYNCIPVLEIGWYVPVKKESWNLV